uniref:Signal peptidase complex catalytic subunit SEC11 n=1 Tax=Callorhinchus milii TaxID=7868 RepID=A0A4W3H593_CALMI
QIPIQLSLEDVNISSIHNLSGERVPDFHYPLWGKLPPPFTPKWPSSNFKIVPLVLDKSQQQQSVSFVCCSRENGDIKFLTKGDNNAVDDRGLYKQGQHWLEKKDVVGRARGFVPYIGIVTILMNDYPKFKYAVLVLLGLFVLVHRE